MTTYPADFACPLIAEHKATVDYDDFQVEFEHGNKRQRRRWSITNTRVALGFAISWEKLFEWQVWVNRNAYDWFKMGLYSAQSSINGGSMLPAQIRFVTDIKVTSLNQNYAKVTLEAEFDPYYTPFIPAKFTNRWIIAGTPAAPSPDWILAEDPVDPLKDFIIAGTPDSPAA